MGYRPIGTSVQGLPIVRAFPFAFDTPGLATGAAVYAPTIGDLLLDAWIEVDTAWDGTTPKADIGRFLSGDNYGMFANGVGQSLDMTSADGTNATEGLLNNLNAGFDAAIGNAAGNLPSLSFQRLVPARFTTADPMLVVVTQTGQIGGGDPAATQGAAILYLVTVTPKA